MNVHRLISCVSFMLLGIWCGLFAQNDAIPYRMGFESGESAELQNWVLNPGLDSSVCADQWLVGTDVSNEGNQALYISCDRMQALAAPGSNIQYAYRDFNLPPGEIYCVSFDWLCPGMQLCAGATYTTLALNASTAGVLPFNISSQLKLTGLGNQQQWNHASYRMSIPASGRIRVFFVWQKDNQQDTLKGACIDNVCITSTSCPQPEWISCITHDCDSMVVNWEGTSDLYQLMWREQTENIWHDAGPFDHSATGSVRLNDIEEGTYDFRVRGICPPDTGSWIYLCNHPVVCPDRHCPNGMTLTDSSVITCYYGRTNYNGYTRSGFGAYDSIGIVDYGWESPLSRHTVNWDKQALDPRTGNQLPLIPPGEQASVRLGNWQAGNGAEAISFKYSVDSTNAILLIKYAVVMQDPSHVTDDQPRFVIDVVDEAGEQIDPACGHCDFAANGSADGWLTYSKNGEMVTFKPWTLIGLNLINYIGQMVTIRYTTYDCFEGAHYAYAYFSMHCSSAVIAYSSCSSASDQQATLAAPEGFAYRWYDSAGTLIDTTRQISLPAADTTTYVCELVSLENEGCVFTLSSKGMPYQPISEIAYTYQPHDCQNAISLKANSYVLQYDDEGTTILRDSMFSRYNWELWDTAGYYLAWHAGDTTLYLPDTGGRYSVKLQSVDQAGCPADTVIEIEVPAIHDYHLELDTALCSGQYIQWNGFGMTIAETGTYTMEMKSRAGCDSIVTLNVAVNPVWEENLDTVIICSDTLYCEDEDCYTDTESGLFIRRLTSIGGCDSIRIRYVSVEERLQVRLDQQIACMGGNPVVAYPLVRDAGNVTEYSVYFDSIAHAAGFADIINNSLSGDTLTIDVPPYTLPGEYEARLVMYDRSCSVGAPLTIDLHFTVNLPASVIFSRWNEVISLKNNSASGFEDLNIVGYQWICNGTEIPGATLSYYYDADGLDMESEYQLALMCDDGSIVYTCPFTPSCATDDSRIEIQPDVFPTMVKPGEQIAINSCCAGEVSVYSMTGTAVATYTLHPGTNPISAPWISGIYFLVFSRPGITPVRIMVI